MPWKQLYIVMNEFSGYLIIIYIENRNQNSNQIHIV